MYVMALTRTPPPVSSASRARWLKFSTTRSMNVFIRTGASSTPCWQPGRSRSTDERDVSIMNTTSAITGQAHVVVLVEVVVVEDDVVGVLELADVLVVVDVFVDELVELVLDVIEVVVAVVVVVVVVVVVA